MITFEYESIRQNPGLISGLTMTIAANDQPVIARVALLHLGTRSSFGEQISDDVVQPAEIKVEDVEDDLRTVLWRLKTVRHNGLSEFLGEVMYDAGNLAVHRVVENILGLIDNKPAWEKKAEEENILARGGAIETIGSPIRPRD